MPTGSKPGRRSGLRTPPDGPAPPRGRRAWQEIRAGSETGPRERTGTHASGRCREPMTELPPPSPRLPQKPRRRSRRRACSGCASVSRRSPANSSASAPRRASKRAPTRPPPQAYRMHTSRPCSYPVCSRARLLPALRSLSSPRPPSRGPSLTRATAAAGGEQAQPLKLPPGPELGPGSGSGATVGGVRCEVTGPRCVHAVAQAGGGSPGCWHGFLAVAVGINCSRFPFFVPGRA